MTSPRPGFFAPSERALDFGRQYADVLARWGELSSAASALVAANVALGQLTADASNEFEQWLSQSANAPWSWLNPDSLQRFMQGFMGAAGQPPPTSRP